MSLLCHCSLPMVNTRPSTIVQIVLSYRSYRDRDPLQLRRRRAPAGRQRTESDDGKDTRGHGTRDDEEGDEATRDDVTTLQLPRSSCSTIFKSPPPRAIDKTTVISLGFCPVYNRSSYNSINVFRPNVVVTCPVYIYVDKQ